MADVPVIGPDGKPYTLDESELPQARAQGFKVEGEEPDRGRLDALQRGFGRAAWAIPGLFGATHAKAQGVYQYLLDRARGGTGQLGDFTQAQERAENAAQAQHPWMTMLGGAAGFAPTAAILPSATPAAGAGLGARALASAANAAGQGLVYGTGTSNAEDPMDRLKEGVGSAAVAAPLGALAPAPLAHPPSSPVPSDFKAEEAYKAAAGGFSNSTMRTVARNDPAYAQRLGRTILDEDILRRPWDQPHTMQVRAEEAARQTGQRLGGIADTLEAGGASIPAKDVFSREGFDAWRQTLTSIRDDALQGEDRRSLAQVLLGLLDQAESHVGPGGALLSFKEAHGLRQMLDDLIYGTKKLVSADPHRNVHSETLSSMRGGLSDEMGGAAQAGGLGGRWATENDLFGRLKDVDKLTQKGIQSEKNRHFGLLETIAGMGGLTAASTLGKPELAVGGLATAALPWLVKKYGSQTAALGAPSVPQVPPPMSLAPAAGSSIYQLWERAKSGDRQAAAQTDFILSQTSREYREAKGHPEIENTDHKKPEWKPPP